MRKRDGEGRKRPTHTNISDEDNTTCATDVCENLKNCARVYIGYRKNVKIDTAKSNPSQPSL